MKGEIKKKYQEYISHIDFPTILYVYETNKVIAMNEYATTILGDRYDDIRDIFKGKKHKLAKDLLEGESRIITDVIVYTNHDEEISIDMDINVILLDNMHLVLLLFAESSKNTFKSNMQVHVPRISWKYENYITVYMNTVLKEDISKLGIDIHESSYLLDADISKKLHRVKQHIVDTGECVFNALQMITHGQEESRFIKLSLMPIIDNRGKNIGIISIHNKILKKSEQRNLYDVSHKDALSYNIYEHILDNIGNEILVCLENHKIVYTNNVVRDGIDTNVIGMDIYDFFSKYELDESCLSEIISEGIMKDSISDIDIYDRHNDRELSVNIRRISWIDNSKALLFYFNEIHKERLCNVGEHYTKVGV